MPLMILFEAYSKFLKPRILGEKNPNINMKCNTIQLSFGETETFDQTVSLSQYVVHATQEALDAIKNKFSDGTEDVWLIGPSYWNKGIITDAQISITGKGFVGENDAADSVIRETAEEVGISINKEKICLLKKTKTAKETWSTFIVFADSTSVVAHDEGIIYKEAADDKKVKCQVFVAGKKDYMSALLKTINCRANTLSVQEAADIKSVCMMPFSVVNEYVDAYSSNSDQNKKIAEKNDKICNIFFCCFAVSNLACAIVL